MDVRGVDPRTGGPEIEPIAYRVYFWERGRRAPEGVPLERIGYVSSEYEIRGAADVFEVLAWINESSAGRTFTLYAVVPLNGTDALVHLSGVDPTRAGRDD